MVPRNRASISEYVANTSSELDAGANQLGVAVANWEQATALVARFLGAKA